MFARILLALALVGPGVAMTAQAVPITPIELRRPMLPKEAEKPTLPVTNLPVVKAPIAPLQKPAPKLVDDALTTPQGRPAMEVPAPPPPPAPPTGPQPTPPPPPEPPPPM